MWNDNDSWLEETSLIGFLSNWSRDQLSVILLKLITLTKCLHHKYAP